VSDVQALERMLSNTFSAFSDVEFRTRRRLPQRPQGSLGMCTRWPKITNTITTEGLGLRTRINDLIYDAGTFKNTYNQSRRRGRPTTLDMTRPIYVTHIEPPGNE
jgi:hypothetical protein